MLLLAPAPGCSCRSGSGRGRVDDDGVEPVGQLGRAGRWPGRCRVGRAWTGSGRPSRRQAAATAAGSRTSVLTVTMWDKLDLRQKDVIATRR